MEDREEYCTYILGLDKDNKTVFWSSDKKKKCQKQDFIGGLRSVIGHLQKTQNIKDEKFNYDKLLVGTVGKFLSEKIIFFGKKPDDEMKRLYVHSVEMMKNEKDTLKKEGRVSYDRMFEILNTMLLILANTIVCEDEKQEKVSFRTTDIDIELILRRIEEYLRIISRENGRKVIKRKRSDSYAVDVLEKGIRYMLVTRSVIGLVGILPNVIKKSADSYSIKQAEKRASIFYYFVCVALATNTRNEELKENSYGW